jgi:hypothetical protein
VPSKSLSTLCVCAICAVADSMCILFRGANVCHAAHLRNTRTLSFCSPADDVEVRDENIGHNTHAALEPSRVGFKLCASRRARSRVVHRGQRRALVRFRSEFSVKIGASSSLALCRVQTATRRSREQYQHARVPSTLEVDKSSI